MPKRDPVCKPQALAAGGDPYGAAEDLLCRAHGLSEALWYRLAYLPSNDMPSGMLNDLHVLVSMLTEEIEEVQELLPHLGEDDAKT